MGVPADDDEGTGKVQMIRRKGRKLPPGVRAAMEKVKESLAEIYGNRLRGIYLYGSYARGDFTEDSDIDLIVALDAPVNTWEEISRLSEVLSDICLAWDVLVSVYPVPAEWLTVRRSPLFENVRREGVLL